MPETPVIFLAFANDHQNYLYKLTEEQNAIRNALRKMQQEGLCEVVYETDTDLDKIWRTFNEYKDRIAIFHYGGHAEDYSLLLQRADGQQQLVDGEGLVSFLARQRGLQLVFINGCSSKRQAKELRDQGIPAVIGTSEPIDDEAATRLSKTFYESLAAGLSIQQAWKDASDMLLADQVKKQEGYYRSVGRKSRAREQRVLDFPWELYIRPGAENVKDWNLPAAARNPLFGLGLPEEAYLRLPDAPFVGLHYFREDDAAVFFGRGAQIRELYNHLQSIHPIILLYGKSGVGKSSILDAGLLPRIKDQYQTAYVRRIQEKGLLGTLDLALEELSSAPTNVQSEDAATQKNKQKELLTHLQLAIENAQNEQLRQRIALLLQEVSEPQQEQVLQLHGVLEKWQRAEAESGKPLLVILDQAEEKFTRPMPEASHQREDELLAFLVSIQPLFGTTESGISGKLILSYRKEYHPEIRDAFRSLSLPYAELFLKRLDREGIIEAIEGVNQHKYTREKYQLQIQDELPVIIADDLMEDLESPIAPVLQIILAKLWSTANGAALPSDRAQTLTQFTIADYQQLKNQGTTMSEFFQQQIEQLEKMKEQRELVHSGLALDLLAAHTTSMGTAGSRHRKQLQGRYHLADVRIDSLLLALEDLSLLSRIDAQTTILAHDTLAPIVIREYNLSDAPGQRAVRILKNKISEVSFQLDPTYLEGLIKAKVPGADVPELKVGYKGPDKYTTVLQASLGMDRWQRDKKEILDQHTRFDFGTGYNRIYLDEADLSIVEEGSGEKGNGIAGMRRLFPEEEELIRISQAARLKREKQRKQRIGAGILAGAMVVGAMIFAFIKMDAANRQTDLSEARRLGNLAKTLVSEGKFTDALHLALASFKKSKTIPIESYEAFNRILNAGFNDTIPTLAAEFDLPTNSLGTATFSPDGQYILTGSDDNSAKVWDLNGKLHASLQGHTKPIKSLSFSPDGNHILTLSEDTTAKLWDFQGNLKADLNQHTDALHAAQFSPDGKLILSHSKDRTAKVWDLKGELLANLNQHSDDISAASFSPDGQLILTQSKDNTAKLWNLKGQSQINLKPPSGNISSASFSAEGEHIIISLNDLSVQIWDLSGNLLIDFNERQYNFNYIEVSPDRQHILTRHDQCITKLWDLSGTLLSEVKSLHWDCQNMGKEFSVGGHYIYGDTYDGGQGTVEVVDLKGKLLYSEDYSGFESVISSPKGKYLVCPDGLIVKFGLEGDVSSDYLPMAEQHLTHSVIFSQNEELILNLITDNTGILWRPEKQEPIAIFHTDNVKSASLSPDGLHILTESDDQVQLWKLSGLPVSSKYGYEPRAISPNGQWYLIGNYEVLKIWNPFSNMEINLVGGFKGGDSWTFSPNGELIMSTGNDSTKVWDLAGNLKANLPRGGARFAPNGQRILTSASDGTTVWDLQGNIKTHLPGKLASVSPNGQLILTCTSDSTTLPNGQLILTCTGDSITVWDLQGNIKTQLSGFYPSFSPNGRRILTSASDSTTVWDLQGNIKTQLSGTSPSFSPNGQLILTSTWDSIKVWDLQGNIKKLFSGTSPSFSPNGQVILYRHRGSFKTWNLNGKGRAENSPKLGHSSNPIFSPDGQYIRTITQDGVGNLLDFTSQLWNLDGQLLADFGDYYDYNDLFSPDGKYIYIGEDLWPTPSSYESWVDSMNLVPLSKEKRLKYGLDPE